MQKSALVIAGGQWQVPLIKFLKNRGLSVFVADPYETSAGVQLADHHIKADVRDAAAILEQVKSLPLGFITTDQSDISVETVAAISEEMNLPANALAVVQLFSNKFLSRKFAQSIGVPVPSFKEVQSPEEIAGFCKENGFPAILKPVDSQSSRGIHKIDVNTTQESFGEYLKDALSTSKKPFALVETFVEGIEMTVEGICSNYKHKSIAYSSKTHFRTGIASSLEYPAQIPQHLIDKVLEANNEYVNKSGLKFGITHAEYIVNIEQEKFWLVEIACRGGGTLISSDIAQWVSGINLYDFLLKNLQGDAVDVEGLYPLRRNAILYFFEFPPGKVKSISGVETAKELDGVLELQLFFQPGDVLKLAADDRSRQGFVILFANTKKELDKRLEDVKGSLKINYEHE